MIKRKSEDRACVSLVAIGRFYSVLLSYKSAVERLRGEAQGEYLAKITEQEKNLLEARKECEEKLRIARGKIAIGRNEIQERTRLISSLEGIIKTICEKEQLLKEKERAIAKKSKELKELLNEAIDKIREAEAPLKNAIVIINKYIQEQTGEIRLDTIPSFRSVPFDAERVVPFKLYDMPEIIPPSKIPPCDDFGQEYYFGACCSHFGDEYKLIKRQGKAYSDYHGTCGPTTVANMLRLLQGREATEKEVLDLAISINACRRPREGATGGGTTSLDIIRILESYGLKAACIRDVSLEEIDECLKRNGALMVAIHSNHIKPNAYLDENPGPKIHTNHWVCVVGTRRSKSTDQVTGVYLFDTGGHNPQQSLIYVSRYYFGLMKLALRDLYAVTAFKQGGTE